MPVIVTAVHDASSFTSALLFPHTLITAESQLISFAAQMGFPIGVCNSDRGSSVESGDTNIQNCRLLQCCCCK